ncbi:MAG: type II secretion system F family protein [Muricomes sp.]
MKGTILIAVMGYLFYNTWLVLFLIVPGVYFYMKSWQEEQCRKKEDEFREQFKEGIKAVAAALNVGYSVENAVREAAKDIKTLFKKDARMRREFAIMIHQLDMNQTIEQVMAGFADRVSQEDVHNFVTVFAASKRTGGDSISIIRSAVRDISEKIEVEKEIQTLLAAKKLEFKVMCIIPFGILLYMRLAFPEFMAVLYGNPLGFSVMTGCLCIYAAAYRLGKKLVEVEV